MILYFYKIQGFGGYHYMASLISKTVKGKQYWYLVESRRVNGKVKQFVLEYIGNQKKLSEYVLKNRAAVQEFPLTQLAIKSYQHGDVHALYHIAKRLGVEEILDNAFGKQMRGGVKRSTSLLLAAIHRASCPGSKNEFHKWLKKTSLPYYLNLHPAAMTSQHFWEQMDGITDRELQQAEDSFTKVLMERYQIGLEKIALDYTNYFTYISTDNARNTIAKRGKNKQKRNDLRQCSLAVVTSKEYGFPLFSHVYEGNHNDQTEFGIYLEQLKQRIPGYVPQEVTIVFDGGSCTKKNMELLDTHYICSFPLAYCKELYEIDLDAYEPVSVLGKEVLSARERKTIWGKECECILTFSQTLYDGQARDLEVKIAKAQDAIQELDKKWKNPRSKIPKTEEEYEKRIHKILSQKYLAEIVCVKKSVEGIHYEIKDEEKQRIMRKFFGKKLLITDQKEWSTKEIIRSYREQDSIEKLFRDTKDTEHFSMRPFYHWTDQKIKVHIFICLLGLSLTAALQKELADRQIKLTKDTLLKELSGIRESWIKENEGKGKVIRKLEEMETDQIKIWKAIQSI